MTVLVKKSVCADCVWRNSCNKFKRIDEMRDGRDNPGHGNDIFDVIVVNCSTKNYDRSYKVEDNNGGGMYYCDECNSMHHERSRIGKLHKKLID